jgi:16S rRNA (guanine527-N7)-methyltransferase
MATRREQFATALRTNTTYFGIELPGQTVELLSGYYVLVERWNELHLVAPCTPQEFAVRHVLESLTLVKHLPSGARVIDVGSGGGLPIVPCLLVREDLHATLIESSKRKAVFLREALRLVQPADRAHVIAARFEEIDFPDGDFLTSRALDRFSRLLPTMIQRARADTKFMLFAGVELKVRIESMLASITIERLPLCDNRFLIIGSKDLSGKPVET